MSCVSRGKKCSFYEKSGVLYFLETPVLRFALLPYYRRFCIQMSLMQRETDMFLQKLSLPTVKPSYNILRSCDHLMINQLDLTEENYTKVLKPIIDILALLETSF